MKSKLVALLVLPVALCAAESWILAQTMPDAYGPMSAPGGYGGYYGSQFDPGAGSIVQQPTAGEATIPPTVETIDQPVTGEPMMDDIFCLPSWHSQRIWGSFDAMLMWRKGRSLPPLVTTSPPGTPREEAGVLGLEDTTILFGDDKYDDGVGIGGRVVMGYWLDGNMDCSVMGRFFGMAPESVTFDATSDGVPTLTRPFTDVTTGLPGVPSSQLIAFVGQDGQENDYLYQGTISIDSSNEILGGDALLSLPLKRGCGYRCDLLGGYQFSRINDGLAIRATTTAIEGGVIPDGTVINGLDWFRTINEFHGGTLGGQLECQRGNWTFLAMGKCGFGNMHQALHIVGRNTTTIDGVSATREGFLLTQPTNIGTTSQDVFCFIPEVNLTANYRYNDHLEFSLGYNFLYWSRVMLAGDQVDLSVNLAQQTDPPPFDPARPAPGNNTTDFWLMGMTLGTTIRY